MGYYDALKSQMAAISADLSRMSTDLATATATINSFPEPAPAPSPTPTPTPTPTQPTFYIDPTAVNNGSGTFSSPYNSWNNVSFSGPNAFLQKAGTTWRGGGLNIHNSGGGIGAEQVIGVYDPLTGARIPDGSKRAIIDGTGFDTCFDVNSGASYLIFDGLELHDSGIVGNQYNAAIVSHLPISKYITIKNMYIHDTHGYTYAVRWCCHNLTFTNNRVSRTGDDGIHGGGSNCEISYNQIDHVSMATAEGDCIQISDQELPCVSGHIHHNTLDHSATDNKQCLILNNYGALGSFHDWLVENNTLIAMLNPPLKSQWGAGLYVPNITFRNNTVINGQRGTDIGSNATGCVITGNAFTNQGTPNYSAIFLNGSITVTQSGNTLNGAPI